MPFSVRVVFVVFFSIVPVTVPGESGDNGITIWDEVYPEVRHRNFNYPEKLNERLLRILHRIVREVGGKLKVHSDYRSPKKNLSKNMLQAMSQVVNSQHRFGLAVDFRLDDYTHLTRRERFAVYYQKTRWIEELLRKYEIYDKVGLGIYPFARNPFWHIDIRGRRARWCRNQRNEYEKYASCKKKMEEEFGSFRSYSSYPKMPPVGIR